METMRLRHHSHTDLLFAKSLELTHKHCLPYAVQQLYMQMESFVYYNAENVYLPRAAELRVSAMVTPTVLALV
jgi:hypothetical protein